MLMIVTWENQNTAHRHKPPGDALLTVFFIPCSPSPCFVAKNSITASAFSCPLISLQSTQASSKYSLVLFPLSHDMLLLMTILTVIAKFCFHSWITFHSVHKTRGYLSQSVNSNADASGAKPQLVRSNIENWGHQWCFVKPYDCLRDDFSWCLNVVWASFQSSWSDKTEAC